MTLTEKELLSYNTYRFRQVTDEEEKMMGEVTMMNLADVPEYAEEVSEWLWEQWAKADGYSLEEIIYRTKHAMLKDTVPQMIVAVCGGKAVGVVSLWLNDLKTRQDLSPWLAALYVKKEYRNMYIGQKLQKAAIEAAKSLGQYEWLYLITEHRNYYEKTGWQFMEMAPAGHGTYERIYKYDLKK